MLKGKKVICLVLLVAFFTIIPCNGVNAATPTFGIDVSKWQGIIDWQGVASNGVNFAFVRVGNTKKGIDPYFYYNMLSAQAMGIKTGVYIYSYARNVEEAALEAQFVLNAVANVPVSYPIVWDVEDDCAKDLSPETLALMANTFCAIIESEGYHPMVYSNKYWFTKKIGPVYFDKWVAQWDTKCDIPDAAVWQFSSKGSIAGIAGDVDLNFSLKDYSTTIVDTGFVNKKGFFYFYNNYKMHRGWLDIGTDKFYFDPLGRMVVGWMPMPEGTYYMGIDGKMSVGLTAIGNKIFYFNENGHLMTGPQVIGDKNFLFLEDGSMFTGWLSDGTYTKYYDNDGHMSTGLTTISNDVYLFDLNGNMQTGIVDLGGQLFLFADDGKLCGPILPPEPIVTFPEQAVDLP